MLVLAFGLAVRIGTVIYAARSRRSGLSSAAASLGLKALHGPNPFSAEEKKGFNVFSRGYGRKWINMFADNVEAPSALFFDLATDSG